MCIESLTIESPKELFPGHLNEIFSSYRQGLLVTTEKGKPISWNKKFMELTRVSNSELCSLQEQSNSQIAGKEAESYINTLAQLFVKQLKNAKSFETSIQQLYDNKRDTDFLQIELKNEIFIEIFWQLHSTPNLGKFYLWNVSDVSKQVKKLQYLQELKDRYETAFISTKHGIWDWDIKNDTIYLSPFSRELFGFVEDVDTGPANRLEAIFELIPAQDRDAIKKKLGIHLASRKTTYETEFAIKTHDDKFFWLQLRALTLRDKDAQAYRMTGSVMEITRRKIAEMNRKFWTTHDRLTKLPNRTAFIQKLGAVLNKMGIRDYKYSFAVLLIRFSRLSIINESLGSQTTRKLIHEISERLSSFIKSQDILARIENNRFIILAENISNVPQINKLIAQLEAILSKPVTLENNIIVLGF